MRFCVRCGREVSEDEIIGNYCIDCYVKHQTPFKNRPRLEVTLCPKCGSWLYKGEWSLPVSTEEVFRRVALNESRRFLRDEVEALDASVLRGVHKISASEHGITLRLNLLVKGKHPIDYELEVPVKISYKPCPSCLMRSGGSHKALVQVRYEGRVDLDRLAEEVEELIVETGLASSVTDVEVVKDGVDVKFEDPVAARKLSSILGRRYGAMTTESFRSTRFDAHEGKWRGVVTISVRIPPVRKGVVVEYLGEVGVVEEVYKGLVKIRVLETGELVQTKVSSYWEGRIRVVEKAHVSGPFLVTGVDKNYVYLLREDSGEMKEVSVKPGYSHLKAGVKVLLLTIEDREYLIEESG